MPPVPLSWARLTSNRGPDTEPSSIASRSPASAPQASRTVVTPSRRVAASWGTARSSRRLGGTSLSKPSRPPKAMCAWQSISPGTRVSPETSTSSSPTRSGPTSATSPSAMTASARPTSPAAGGEHGSTAEHGPGHAPILVWRGPRVIRPPREMPAFGAEPGGSAWSPAIAQRTVRVGPAEQVGDPVVGDRQHRERRAARGSTPASARSPPRPGPGRPGGRREGARARGSGRRPRRGRGRSRAARDGSARPRRAARPRWSAGRATPSLRATKAACATYSS